uniref:Uncharacterized protein n=1 Tax=Chenopodium quinoa TaxID=63459 RepID=A0A803MZU4_CHEQI
MSAAQAQLYQNLMAEKMPTKDNIADFARESLIALSNSLPDKLSNSPDKFPNSPHSSEKVTYVGNTVNEKDGTVDYWSELISLSYPTPDAESVPHVKG